MRKFQFTHFILIVSFLFVAKLSNGQDVGVTSITSITDYCNRTQNIQVSVTWQEFTGSVITAPADFEWELNGVILSGVEQNNTQLGTSGGTYDFTTPIDFNDLNNGVNTFKAYANVPGSIQEQDNNDTTYLTFYSWVPSVGGTTSTGDPTTVCAGDNSGTINLAGKEGDVVRWEFSENDGVTWQSSSNTTTVETFSNLTVTTVFRAVVQSGAGFPGACAEAVSSTTTITVNPIPDAPVTSSNSPICELEDLEFDLTWVSRDDSWFFHFLSSFLGFS